MVFAGAVTALGCFGTVLGCAIAGGLGGAAINATMQATMRGRVDLCEMAVASVVGTATAGTGAIVADKAAFVAKQVVGKSIGKGAKRC